MNPQKIRNATTEMFSDKSFIRKINGKIMMAAKAFDKKLDMRVI